MRGSRLVPLTLAALIALLLPAAASAQGRDRVIEAAIAALQARSSYQIELELRAPYFGDDTVITRRTVDNDPVFAYRDVSIVDGEEAVVTLLTPDGEWTSKLGGPWIEVERGPSAQADARSGPAIQRLQILVNEGLVLSEVGPELLDGRSVIRYAGELPPESGVAGTVDVWLDAAGGWLVKAVADLRLPEGTQELTTVPTLPAYEVTRVSRVDDPTIVIAAPDVDATPVPIPPGDPALAAVVARAFDGLSELPSYVATVDDRTTGFASIVETVVVNGERPAALVTYRIGDTVMMQAMATDGLTQVRDGLDGAWGPADPETFSCDAGSCDIEALTTFDRGIQGRSETFVVVSEAETLDGVPVLHLRSEAGQTLTSGDEPPGVTDLWIAKDGGHVLRMDFDGQGTRSSLVISRIGDPAIGGFAGYAPPPSPAG